MNRRRAGLAAVAALAVAGIAQGVHALQQTESAAPAATSGGTSDNKGSSPAVAPGASPPVAATPRATQPPQVETPMAKRVAVLGLLNKRNGIARDVTMRPGDTQRIGDVVLRLRACDKTAPWEPQLLTGAFVQTDVRGPDGRWRRQLGVGKKSADANDGFPLVWNGYRVGKQGVSAQILCAECCCRSADRFRRAGEQPLGP